MQEYKLAIPYEILQLVSYDRNNFHQTKKLNQICAATHQNMEWVISVEFNK